MNLMEENASLEFIGFEVDFNERYDLNKENLIRQNSNSKVYRSINKKNKKEYAIKIFNKVQSIEEFMNNMSEVFGMIRIGIARNENVINLHQIFVWTEKENQNKQEEMVLAIVTDLCELGCLGNIIKNARKNCYEQLPIYFLEKMTNDLISSFNHLNEKAKLHHKFINPDKILVQKNGKVKIDDFEACKLLPWAKKKLQKVKILKKKNFKNFCFLFLE